MRRDDERLAEIAAQAAVKALQGGSNGSSFSTYTGKQKRHRSKPIRAIGNILKWGLICTVPVAVLGAGAAMFFGPEIENFLENQSGDKKTELVDQYSCSENGQDKTSNIIRSNFCVVGPELIAKEDGASDAPLDFIANVVNLKYQPPKDEATASKDGYNGGQLIVLLGSRLNSDVENPDSFTQSALDKTANAVSAYDLIDYTHTNDRVACSNIMDSLYKGLESRYSLIYDNSTVLSPGMLEAAKTPDELVEMANINPNFWTDSIGLTAIVFVADPTANSITGDNFPKADFEQSEFKTLSCL